MSLNSYDDLHLFKIGMVVYTKRDNCSMTVEKFHMDDFSQRFCDRLECSWYDGAVLKKEIINYEDLDFPAIRQKVNLHLPASNDAVGKDEEAQSRFPNKLSKKGFVMPPDDLTGWIVDP